MSLMWFEFSCPNCKTTNWVDNGDPEDMTCGDNEGYQCWKCEREFTVDGEEADDAGFIPGDPLPHWPYSKLVKLLGEEKTKEFIK